MARQLARRRSAPPEDDYGYDDDIEPEEQPTRRRSFRSAEDEDLDEPVAPRRSRRRVQDEVEEPEESSRRRRPSRRDEEDDEAPRRAKRRSARDEPEAKRSASKGAGWDTLKDERAKKSNGNRLAPKDKEVIIHFMEEEPFAVYQQHWVGNRSYSCPGEKCPLCDQGYDTRTLALFNVVDMKTAASLYWEAGPNAAKKIIEASERKQSSPINRDDLYFAINRTKQSNGFFDFSVAPVKERDLVDDWEMEPLTEEELAEAEEHLYDESVIKYDSPRDLRAVADGDDDE
jgi:hypothetical protein